MESVKTYNFKFYSTIATADLGTIITLQVVAEGCTTSAVKLLAPELLSAGAQTSHLDPVGAAKVMVTTVPPVGLLQKLANFKRNELQRLCVTSIYWLSSCGTRRGAAKRQPARSASVWISTTLSTSRLVREIHLQNIRIGGKKGLPHNSCFLAAQCRDVVHPLEFIRGKSFGTRLTTMTLVHQGVPTYLLQPSSGSII